MKNFYTLLLFLFASVSILAQAPEKMSYQAVLRDASNTLLTNQEVGMQISILQSTATGTAVYVETQTVTSNINGLVTLEIGTGSVVSGDFTTIDWSTDNYFIKTETDPAGGTTYTITGTSQLMSVPFAMYAKTSGNAAPGPQGAQGTQGIQGAAGAAGTDGTNGIQGTQGATGAVGADGAAGTDGTNGIQGTQGAPGAVGADGAAGTDGTDGTQGIQGATGSLGAQGDVGEKGDTGDQGTQGIQGNIGSVGAVGATGTTGTNGAKGDTGITGDKGDVGEKGDTGDQGTQGIQGNIGSVGAVGATGTTGTNGAKGDTGITGDKGDVGEKGIQGIQGATGTAGTNGINGEKGATGDQGTQGIQGAIGTTGTNGTNGAKGDVGEKGDIGDQGAQGIQGATGADGATGIPTGGTEGQVLKIVGGIPTWVEPVKSTGQAFYEDTDNDGYGDINSTIVASAAPNGYVSDNTDCNDTDAAINPATVWFIGVDTDGDTFFGSTTSLTQCEFPGTGYVIAEPAILDCDDSLVTGSSINPDAIEVPANGIDDDCDGQVDLTTVGELREGGIVFWVDPADNNHGKVCALEDADTGLEWDDAIIYSNSYTNADTGTGVHSDWYLPSRDELQLMYANLQRFGCSTNTTADTDPSLCPTRKGNFSYSYYWSSTVYGFNLAWYQYFENGNQDVYGKSSTDGVRAVRAF
jgi:hypothetical protein